MAKKKTSKRGRPSYAEIASRLAAMERQLAKRRGPGRPRKEKENLKPTGKLTLEIERNGKVIRRFRGLSKQDFAKYRRDFYKVLVGAMKEKISMNKIVEYKAAE